MPLPPANGVLATIGPGEVLGAVVGSERDDRVLLEAVVLQIGHDRADDVVELGHAGFLNAPAVLGRAHGLVLVREMGDDVHPRGVEPEEERLACALGAVSELKRVSQDLAVQPYQYIAGAKNPIAGSTTSLA